MATDNRCEKRRRKRGEREIFQAFGGARRVYVAEGKGQRLPHGGKMREREGKGESSGKLGEWPLYLRGTGGGEGKDSLSIFLRGRKKEGAVD